MRTSALAVRRWPPRRIAGALAKLVLLAAVAAWFLLLRPQALGGPADYMIVSGTSMEPTYSTGDVVVVRRQATYRTGDVVAYRVPAGDVGAGTRVIHRIVGGSSAGFVLRGDNRDASDPWRPTERDVVGSEWLHVPRGGYVILAVRSPLVLASLAAALAATALLRPGGRGAARP